MDWRSFVTSAFLFSFLVIPSSSSPSSSSSSSSATKKAEEFFSSGHTNNWAVLVDSSRFWFNYRHVANVLSMYRRSDLGSTMVQNRTAKIAF